MKKYLVSFALILVVLLAGCASEPEGPEMIDYKGKEFNREVPEWYFMADYQISQELSDFEELFVIKVESEPSQSQAAASRLLSRVDVRAEAALLINSRVQEQVVSATVGDNDFMETYMEELTKVLAEADISGLRKLDEFWVQKRYRDEDGYEDLYTVVQLYGIAESTIQDLVQSALDGTEPETEEELTARDRVREALADGF